MKENVIVENDLQLFIEHFPYCDDICGKTFLVTGATGLIGSIFIKCLLRLNEWKGTDVSVIGIARSKEKVLDVFGDAPVVWVCQDMRNPLSLPDVQIDYIVHCASPTSSRFYVENPVETMNTAYIGTDSLLQYAREKGIRSFVYLSSLESYGAIHDDRWITEEECGYISPTDVRSSYSLGKRAVECLCHSYAKEYRVPVKIARLTQTFGAGVSLNDTRVFAQFAKSIIAGKDIEMHTEGKSAKPYCYTIDAVNAIFCILLHGADGEAYNVANASTFISIHDMAEFMIREFNPQCHLTVNVKENMGYAPVTILRLNTEKLENLGWKPLYNLKNMYAKLIDYYKSVL